MGTIMSFDTTLREVIRAEIRSLLPELLPGKEEYLSTKEVADLTGLSTSFFEVARSVGAEDQPPYTRVGRRVIYKRSEVETWMESRK